MNNNNGIEFGKLKISYGAMILILVIVLVLSEMATKIWGCG